MEGSRIMLMERDGYKLRFGDFIPDKKEEEHNEPKMYKNDTAVDKAWTVISVVSIICLACAYGLDALYGGKED